MDSLEEQLISIKNPFKAFLFSQKYKIWNTHIHDKNSFVWINFTEQYYSKFLEYKITDLSLMDYYVLLYLLDTLQLIHDKMILHYSQVALCSLPKIYDGDHLQIIQFINTLGFRKGLLNLLLFRNNDKNNRGTLNCYFSENEEHMIAYYTNIPDVKKIKNSYCNPSDGLFTNLPEDL